MDVYFLYPFSQRPRPACLSATQGGDGFVSPGCAIFDSDKDWILISIKIRDKKKASQERGGVLQIQCRGYPTDSLLAENVREKK